MDTALVLLALTKTRRSPSPCLMPAHRAHLPNIPCTVHAPTPHQRDLPRTAHPCPSILPRQLALAHLLARPPLRTLPPHRYLHQRDLLRHDQGGGRGGHQGGVLQPHKTLLRALHLHGTGRGGGDGGGPRGAGGYKGPLLRALLRLHRPWGVQDPAKACRLSPPAPCTLAVTHPGAGVAQQQPLHQERPLPFLLAAGAAAAAAAAAADVATGSTRCSATLLLLPGLRIPASACPAGEQESRCL